MIRTKIFTVTQPGQMEELVNQWLSENPAITVVQVCQSESRSKESWSMTLTMFYSEPLPTHIGFVPAG
jgi:hypothetical protein